MGEEGKMERRRFWSVFLAAAGLVVLYCLLQKITVIGTVFAWITDVFSPILLGFIIAFILNLPMRGLEHLWERCDIALRTLMKRGKGKKKSGKQSLGLSMAEAGKVEMGKISKVLCRPICLLVSIVIIISILCAIVSLVLPEIGNAVKIAVNGVPDFIRNVQEWALKYANEYPLVTEFVSKLDIDWEETAKTVLSFIGSGTLDFVGDTFMHVINTLGGVIDFIISFIFAIYVLLSKETLARQVKRMLRAFFPKKVQDVVLHVGETAHGIFCAFVTGQCIEAVILGSLCAIGMVIFRFPYAAMIGVLVGVTALIPVVGGFIGAGVGAFLILLSNPWKALMFVLYIVILQQIEGNIIYPKVVGSSVGLPAMWVLAAVSVGGGIGGIVGMLFAVPVVSVLYTLLREITTKRLQKKEAEECNGSI